MSEVVTEPKTVGQHMLSLLDEYFQSGAFSPVSDAHRTLVQEKGLSWNDEMPQPEKLQLEVGQYLTHFDGEDVEFYARCGTTVELDEMGRLVFRGSASNGGDAVAVLDVERLKLALNGQQ